MTQQEITVILPNYDNDGLSLRTEREEYLHAALEITGGLTTFETVGRWIGEGSEVFTDNGHAVVMVTDSDEKVSAIRALTVQAKAAMRQQAMFFQVRPVTVEFI